MLYVNNDYNECCHSAILERLQQLTGVQLPGYGTDAICQEAKAIIRKLCGREDAAVHFLVGGTQTNLTVIAASLRPYQAVVAADSGHIHVHETGAIEAVGHKIIALPSADGKITGEQILREITSGAYVLDPEHTVQPKQVYISHPTEVGTLYTLEELKQIRKVCDQQGMTLFVDGARLGYGLTASDTDVTLQDLAALADVFYIGGTKVGAMFGEAVVITNPCIEEGFRHMMKQKGGMLAKGWLLGVQFQVLLEDGLYFRIAKEANRQADRIRQTLKELGVPFFMETTANQVFPILPNTVLSKLEKEFTFACWEVMDQDHTAVRFCTSWATRPEDTEALCAGLKAACNNA